jgi:hypothetical protein
LKRRSADGHPSVSVIRHLEETMVPAPRASRSAVSPFAACLLSIVLLPIVPTGQDHGTAPTAAPVTVLTSDAQREAFLAKARVVRTRPAAKGVTQTLRVTLSDGVVTHDASIQTIDESRAVYETPQGTEMNFKDSWRFNVAAYRLDRLLEIGMIPPTVERRHAGKPASFTWWVDDVLMDEQQRYRGNQSAPDTEDWNQQMWTTRLFDQLIANVDRNLGNLLIDKQWTIWMIDHSRAFRTNTALRSPDNLSKVERRLLDRMRQLDRDRLRRAARGYLNDDEIKALLQRRDRIVEHFEAGGLALLFDRKARCC